MPRVVLIGTVDSKRAEIDDLIAALARHGLEADVVDISLQAGGAILTGCDKIGRMAEVAETGAKSAIALAPNAVAAIGLGGGTGSEMALSTLKSLPATYPKLLITTLAFDPREALADTAITLVPTLCDLEGLNPMLRQVFENTAAQVAGLSRAAPIPLGDRPNIAVTTLGATGAASAAVTRRLQASGYDATVFHANGYGGAAFSRFVKEQTPVGVIDLNVHELGRLLLAGAHVPMPTRFQAATDLPRVVMPGALNFLGLGAKSTLSAAHLNRPHYQHSGHFTHVGVTEQEMSRLAQTLASNLNQSTAPCHVIIPMGGFSHEDRPGGAIEAPTLREIAAETLEAEARAYSVARLPHHINTDATARSAVEALLERMPDD